METRKMEIKLDENISVLQSDIDIYINEFINTLHDPDDIYNNRRLISDLLRYLYNNCIVNLLNNTHKNGNRYDILLLDKLFYICCDIVHRYNSNMYILLFCNFVNINRDTINRWKNNVERELTPQECDAVKKWFGLCELDLLQGSSVFDIFLLKASYNYNDSIQARPDENISKQNIDSLPSFNNEKLLIDSNN